MLFVITSPRSLHSSNYNLQKKKVTTQQNIMLAAMITGHPNNIYDKNILITFQWRTCIPSLIVCVILIRLFVCVVLEKTMPGLVRKSYKAKY